MIDTVSFRRSLICNFIFLLALEEKELVNLLPLEKHCGENNQEHIEGHFEVDLLERDSLSVQVLLATLVRGYKEAHDC